jgi:hypothetical protein
MGNLVLKGLSHSLFWELYDSDEVAKDRGSGLERLVKVESEIA